MSLASTLTLPGLRLESTKPAMVEVEAPGDPAGWAAEHRDAVRTAVAEHGAVLVRGLGLHDIAGIDAVFGEVGTGLMVEREAFAGRDLHGPGLYSSSTWPASQQMCMHHESSYALEFPGMMMFACLAAPTTGGATALADAAAVLAALPPELVDRFDAEGWLLTRTYGADIGASLTDAFGSDDPLEVERHCVANGIEFEWRTDGVLYTRQRRAAIIEHPVTGHQCWFNQVAFLSEWTMAEEVREYLLDLNGPDGLPFNTYYGEGEPLGADVVTLINEVYDAHTVREPWRPGDLLLVDNIRAAHSREPYTGTREVLVGMTDALRLGPVEEAAPW